jgi:hypothetical protein
MANRWHNYFEDGAVCFWTSSIIERIPARRSPTAGILQRGVVCRRGRPDQHRLVRRLAGALSGPSAIGSLVDSPWAFGAKSSPEVSSFGGFPEWLARPRRDADAQCVAKRRDIESQNCQTPNTAVSSHRTP